MKNQFDLLKLKEMVLADIMTWKSMQVKYKSQVGKIQAEENLTEDAFNTIMLVFNLVEYNVFNPNDERLCDYTNKVEQLLNSDLNVNDIFAEISELGFGKVEKSKIGEIIEKVVPLVMIFGAIAIFFNPKVGGTLFLSGVGLWVLLNGLDFYFAKSKPRKINLNISLYLLLAVFFFGLGVYLFFIIYLNPH